MLSLVALLSGACDKIDIVSPPGPRGMSAYEVWVEQVNKGTIAWTQGTDIANYFKFLKGEKGGKRRVLNLVERVDRRRICRQPPSARAEVESRTKTQKRLFYFLTGAKGDDGLTPFINAEGNWQIGDKDTGIP